MGIQADLGLAPRDESAYLIVDEQWRIIGTDESANLAAEQGSMTLVGQSARDVIGPEALAELQRRGSATFMLDTLEYVLVATPFQLPTGFVRVIRAQEMHSTLEHVLSLIVHELRNPLSAVRALVQGLEEEVSEMPSARVYTRRITGEIDRLGRLLNSMAQVARPSTRPPEILRPDVVLERAAAIFRPELAQRGIGLHVHVTPRAGAIYADPDQIQQVLVNLVANAVEAMPQGGTITLRARLDPRGRPVIQVEDTGAGMNTAALERALRPRQSTKPGGMGLGLTIVHSIVRQHAGRLRLASTPGRGTTVSITFPTVEHLSGAGPEAGPIQAGASLAASEEEGTR
ncbi:MAG: GHKL domain-containing protein [Ktedonobacterales bacterium]|nr:GHKL domain-containing protein [Ktedonobacterales bacterium]